VNVLSKSVFKSVESRENFRAAYNGILSRFPFEQTTVETGYGQTFLLHAGAEDGPPVILLHGSCSNSAFMTPELAALSARFSVYAADIVGEAGNSADIRPELHSDGFALWLRDVLDALWIKSAVLAGSSLGGWISLKFAVTFPERVSSLILISPAGLAGQKNEIVEKALRAKEQSETMSVDAAVTGGQALPKEVEAFMNLILMSYDPVTEILPVFTDEELSRLTMPILFVGGENDVMLDAPGAARRLEALLPHADVRLLPNAGHMILNAPDYILPFLQKDGKR
jgi:pimeloyl-ACP methyl ester carboxylesterase